MKLIELINNIDFTIYPSDQVLAILSSVLLFFANFIYYFLYLIKFYRILCFSKITFDGLPMINPYIWPFSFFRVLTQPYFSFWSKLLPSFKSGKSSFDISLILALEGISAIIYVLTQVRLLMLIEASELASKIIL
jgi:hypothetical protein